MDGQRMPTRRNLKSDVADVVREKIFGGELIPESRIDQDQLAEELSVSKLPVREALISLEAEGLVVVEPRRGAYVAGLSEDDIRDHFAIFGAVAALASETAAMSLSDDQIAALDEIIDEMETETDFDQLRRLNDDFHRRIHRSASKRTRGMLAMLAHTMPSRFYEAFPGWESAAHSDHRQIVEALRTRNPKAAADHTVSHFRRNGELAVANLRESGFWDDSSNLEATGDGL